MRPEDQRAEIRRLNGIIQAQQARIAELEAPAPLKTDLGVTHGHARDKKTELEHHKPKT